MLRFVPLAGLLTAGATLLLAGCGGPNNDTGVSSANDSPALAGFSAGATDADQTDVKAATTAVAAPEPRAALRRAVAALTHDPSRSRYALTMDERGLGRVAGTVTFAAKGDLSRATLEGTYAGHSGAIAVAREPGADYLCIDGQGQQACLKTKPETHSPVPLPSVLDLPATLAALAMNENTVFRAAPSQRHAGRAGHCWESAGDNVLATFCVADSDGALLLYEGALRGADGVVRLTEYTKSASAADVEPPYVVTELPGY